MIKLADYMRSDQESDFETGLKGLSSILQKGYSNILMTYCDLMRKMMNYFTKLGKSLEVTFASNIGLNSRLQHLNQMQTYY
jgi:hypothetical protein